MLASPVVLSGCEVDYPPFCFVDESGAAAGFSVELLRAALGAMGRDVSFGVGQWASVKEWLEDGTVECLPLVGRTPEREALFDFTFPYMSLHGAVVVRSDCDSIRSIEDLSGLVVGVMTGDNAEEFLLRGDYGVTLVSTPSFETALQLLSEGSVDAVVAQRLVALRLVSEMGLVDLRVLDWPIQGFRQDWCFAVREGNDSLLAVLNEGLSIVMVDGTYSHLHSKWFASMEMPSRVLVMAGDRNFPPYEFLDSLGNPAGLNVDLMRAVAAEVGLDIEIRLGDWSSVRAGLLDGSVDGLTGMFYSPGRDLDFGFTQPHTVVHYVAVVRSGDAPASLAELSGLTVVVQRGDIMHDYLLDNGFDSPGLVSSQEEALFGVVSGVYDCAVVSRVGALWFIEREGWELVLGKTPLLSPGYCFAVGTENRALLSQLSEGLRVIHENGTYHRIFEEWMGEYVEEPPVSFLEAVRRSLVVLVPLAFVLLWVILWLRLMRRQVRVRTAELRRSESLLNTTQRITRMGGWEYDVTRGRMFWTLETYAIHDMNPPDDPSTVDEHISASVQCYPHPDRERVFSAFNACVKTGEPYEMECRFTSMAGREMWVRTAGRAVLVDGVVVRVVGYIQDITAEVDSREQLRYKDSLLREMGSIALVGGWEFDPRTGSGSWTDEVASIHDLPPGAGTTMELGLSFYTGESRRRILRAVREAAESGTPYDLELELVTRSGERKWVRTIGRPETVEGVVVKVHGSFQDITSMKASEARIEHLNLVLRAIRDVNQLIVRETDPQALIEKAADILVDHRSYKSALLVRVDSSGHPISWTGEGLAKGVDALEAMLDSGIIPDCFSLVRQGEPCSVVNRKLTCSTCPLGERCDSVLSLCAPLDHKDLRYGYLAVAMQDDTRVDEEEMSLLAEMAGDLAYALAGIRESEALVQAEVDREEMQRQLLQSQKMEAIGQLAGGVAHDFNNMLQVIMGHAQMLAELCDHADAEASQGISEILRGAKRASELTRQLLLFSRRQVMTLQTLNFNEIVENVLKMIRRLIGEHIRLEWLPGASVGSVQADAGMMEQVLMNLCVNARDAMPTGGVLTIETANVVIDSDYCRAHSWARPGRFVLLSVTDTGVGMDRETLDRVFEPFYTTKEEGKGTGIGLATVYGIVKQHDGMIGAYSEPGKGSLFKVYLPMTEQKAVKVGVRLEGAVSGGSETILLAEDDELVRELARKMLERAGYNVLVAVDGEEAIEVFRAAPRVDLLLLDVIMPRLGGHEALDRIRAIRPDVPALFSSGYSENAIHTNFVLHEGLALVQKPYSSDELLRAVRKALDQPRIG
jgi:ABC-type amino acid transport substrate-binding protein/signal transduction histidine kinase/CheY-like chemotaxis protein